MADVIRIEYETANMFYKVHIAATDMEEAHMYLKKNVKGHYKITSTSNVCRIDAITEQARPFVRIENEIDTKPMKSEKMEWKCPWCKDSFGTEVGLKVHISKKHK